MKTLAHLLFCLSLGWLALLALADLARILRPVLPPGAHLNLLRRSPLPLALAGNGWLALWPLGLGVAGVLFASCVISVADRRNKNRQRSEA